MPIKPTTEIDITCLEYQDRINKAEDPKPAIQTRDFFSLDLLRVSTNAETIQTILSELNKLPTNEKNACCFGFSENTDTHGFSCVTEHISKDFINNLALEGKINFPLTEMIHTTKVHEIITDKDKVLA